MTKRILSFLVVMAIIFVLPASTPIHKNAVNVSAETTESVKADDISSVVDGVLTARFENMLNHNFVYDDDFTSDKTIIENSILALLDKSENGEIDQGLVLGFIAGMYGRQVDPATAVYDFLPASEGKFAILPRGYSEYKHTIRSITAIEGGYTVFSDMLVLTHDGEEYTLKATTVFVPNEGSSFGYNIVSSTTVNENLDI